VTSIRVSTVIDASPARVWEALADLPSHVVWMHDAVSIDITSRRTSGKGTTFVCRTRVGPLRTDDRMEITTWRPRRQMGVRHRGVISGKGAFVLRSVRRGRTRFTWRERLRFPWWMGGPFGGLVAAPWLRLLWRRNLRTLKRLVEAGAI
jgi:hypothetical protein